MVAGKSTDGVNGPPLWGSGSTTVDSVTVVDSVTTSESDPCAMAVGTRISIATNATVASKTSFFTREPPSSTFLLLVRYLRYFHREDGAAP
jgi:hypothetical protein